MASINWDGDKEGRHGWGHKQAENNWTVTQRPACWGDLLFSGDCFFCSSSTGCYLSLPCQRSSSLMATAVSSLRRDGPSRQPVWAPASKVAMLQSWWTVFIFGSVLFVFDCILTLYCCCLLYVERVTFFHGEKHHYPTPRPLVLT